MAVLSSLVKHRAVDNSLLMF